MNGGVATGAAAALLAAVQLLPRWMPRADDAPRRRWLSAAGAGLYAALLVAL